MNDDAASTKIKSDPALRRGWTTGTCATAAAKAAWAGLIGGNFPDPVEVTLPDSWKPAGLRAAGVGRYRMAFEVSSEVVSDATQAPWSLRIDYLNCVHTIWLNGELLQIGRAHV